MRIGVSHKVNIDRFYILLIHYYSQCSKRINKKITRRLNQSNHNKTFYQQRLQSSIAPCFLKSITHNKHQKNHYTTNEKRVSTTNRTHKTNTEPPFTLRNQSMKTPTRHHKNRPSSKQTPFSSSIHTKSARIQNGHRTRIGVHVLVTRRVSER